MTTALAIREPNQVLLTSDQLSYIAATEFVPPGLRGNLPAILACVAMGRELGIGDMVALKSIHIIDGKATFSAELMVQLVRKRGHSITGDVGPAVATVTGTRVDNGDSMTCTWTLEMADRAGLLNKSNWRKYPESMLWARAASQLCRMLFADCFAGNTYTPEELGDEDSSSEPSGVATSPQAVPLEHQPASLDEQAAGDAGLLAPPAAATEGDVPFGDDYKAPILPAGSHKDKPPSAAMLKKLNVLVGKLRPDHLSTLHLYQSMGKDPRDFEGAVDSDTLTIHWSPLRDSLTFSEAMHLIDRLEKYAADKLATFKLEDL